MRQLLLLSTIIFWISCSINSEFNKKRFSFYRFDKPREIAIKAPKGFLKEQVKVGEFGKEQFYTYKEGSLLYIGLNMTWLSDNQVRRNVPVPDSVRSRSGIYKGVDKKGLHWKEIHFETFILGYSYVPPGRLELFEEAVNSIRFR
jgi:hypothetical protein